LLKLKKLIKRLSGELEIDGEALFAGHRKGKSGWGSEGKNLFGIYQRNGKVIIITFPVSDRKHDTLIPLKKHHNTKKGSLYYTDDHTAYAALKLTIL
jgi:hypothetical protein